MFYYKTSISKKAVRRKLRKPHLWEYMTILRERGHLATKVSITFFVGIDVLIIFHLTTVSKDTIFSKITTKIFLGGATIFEGTGRRTTKINITIFLGNGVSSTIWSFFLKNSIPSDLNPKNWFWGYILPHICGSIGPIVSENYRIHPWVDPHQQCEFHEN